MTNDRSYWRDQTDARLIDEAAHYPGAELCIALGERLQDAAGDAKLTEYLTDQLSMAAAAAQVMQAEIKALEAQIRDLLGATDND